MIAITYYSQGYKWKVWQQQFHVYLLEQSRDALLVVDVVDGGGQKVAHRQLSYLARRL